jgi:hypothetical protein
LAKGEKERTRPLKEKIANQWMLRKQQNAIRVMRNGELARTSSQATKQPDSKGLKSGF